MGEKITKDEVIRMHLLLYRIATKCKSPDLSSYRALETSPISLFKGKYAHWYASLELLEVLADEYEKDNVKAEDLYEM